MSIALLTDLVLDLGKTAKDSISKQGMLAWQYNTIGVSDAITMGNEGKPKVRILDRRRIS